MSTDVDLRLEAELQKLQVNAPRLTPQHIDSRIKGVTFTRLPSMKVMVCEMTLANGFTVRGESAIVSPENFRQEIGEKVSKDRAYGKIWELEGYLLQQRLYEEALQELDLPEDRKLPKRYTKDEIENWRDDAFRVALELIDRIKPVPDDPTSDFMFGQIDIVKASSHHLMSKNLESYWYVASVLTPTFQGKNIEVVMQMHATDGEVHGYYGASPDQSGLADREIAFHTLDHKVVHPMLWTVEVQKQM
jgi:hypothetical protein